MKITDALLGEHGAIKAMFDHVEDALPRLDTAGEAVALARVVAAVLDSHARLEDELLFPAIAALGPPLAVMRAEHAAIDDALAAACGAGDRAAATAALREVLAIARPHFLKEERVLFRLAAQTTAAAHLDELGAAWAEARGVELGAAPACASAPARGLRLRR